MKSLCAIVAAGFLCWTAKADQSHTSLSTEAKGQMDSLATKISATIEAKRPHGYLAKLPDGSELFLLTNSDEAPTAHLDSVTVYPIGKYSYATDDVGNMATIRKVTNDIGLAADYVLSAGVAQVEEEKQFDSLPQWSPPNGPHAVENFSVQQSNASGAAGQVGDDSPAALATELGRYRARVYRAVGSRWYAKVGSGSMLQVLGVGTVHFTYTIYSDGHLEVVSDPDANNPALMLLHSISVNSMSEAAPFPPFSDAMRKEVGNNSFTEDFTFSVRN